MRDDLLDAYAAVDWARSYLPTIEQELKSWFEAPPYLLVEELHPEMGKKLFKLEINRRFPLKISAGVGAAVNSLRSSLDLLASSLATRNGKTPRSERHFPIYESVDAFIDPKNMAKRKKWLSAIDCQIIENLKPYRGGDKLIFPLHQLDIARKHERLVIIHLTADEFTVSPECYRQGFEFTPVWPSFKDGAIIGSTRIDEPVIVTLRQFAGAADSIIQLFHFISSP